MERFLHSLMVSNRWPKLDFAVRAGSLIEAPRIELSPVTEKKSPRTRSRSNRPRRRRWLRRGLAVLALGLVVAAGLLLWPFWQLSSRFESRLSQEPSRLYGQATVLAVDDRVDRASIVKLLEGERYRKGEAGNSLLPGRFRVGTAGDTLEVYLRRFLTAEGMDGGHRVELRWRGSRLVGIEVDGRPVTAVILPPPLLASYYDDQLEERWPVSVDEVPEELVDAILAAEDDAFFDHAGLSLSGILRAVWVNLTDGDIVQGGSTLTQQLVKNLYLTPERTLGRKSREALLAVLLELRYEKRTILQAYLNEIYLGASGGVNLIGIGAASRAYFSKEPAELDLNECTTLAAMIRAPARSHPARHAETLRERRDWVLRRMVELKLVAAERAATVEALEVPANLHPVERRRAPYFAQAAAEEAARRFAVEDLAEGGWVLFSTLSPRDQAAAQETVAWGLEALEEGWQKGVVAQGPLQAALVSVDPVSGGIRAYVGGRDWGQSQFDRAGRARRQVGSAFKPVVYAAAFATGAAHPASWLDDSPLTVRLAGREWSPQNHGRQYLGWVTARTAIERSLNTATARLALRIGVDPVVELAREMGIASPLQPVPALALGAAEVTPLELATVYATLANSGVRPPVHGLEAVRGPEGEWLEGRALPKPEAVVSPEVAYLVTSTLQGVLDRGTGQGVRRMGLADPLAGKTGTSNDRRDNWFAGYSPHRATVVWVGYDDNSETRLSGARGALPLWARFTAKVRPRGGYRHFSQPPGVITAAIDPESGGLATGACPHPFTEVFLEDQVPEQVCPLHNYERTRRTERRHPFRRWLNRVFGGG